MLLLNVIGGIVFKVFTTGIGKITSTGAAILLMVL